MDMINTIFQAGDDALGYEFQASFGPIPFLKGPSSLNVRITTVEIPPKTLGEYEYRYKSERMVKPNGQIETAKEFSIEFRMDKYYAIYKAFSLWQSSIVNPVSGGVAQDAGVNGESAIRIPITITSGTYDIEGNFIPTTQVWSFTGCWPKEVGGFSLDNSNGDPLLTAIRFGYLSMR